MTNENATISFNQSTHTLAANGQLMIGDLLLQGSGTLSNGNKFSGDASLGGTVLPGVSVNGGVTAKGKKAKASVGAEANFSLFSLKISYSTGDKWPSTFLGGAHDY
jgi:hypothetical protein